MTPQEQGLLSELFDRLAKSEANPRDLDAERMIADGLRRAPHAVYALVQTALVQAEANQITRWRPPLRCQCDAVVRHQSLDKFRV